MIDINATDFIERFDPASGTVGIIGLGYVGTAVAAYFDGVCPVVKYDKLKSIGSLDEVIEKSELVFVCVPTPMRSDGSCYTKIVENVLEEIISVARRVDRNTNDFVIVLKSTVDPGFTARMRGRHPTLRIIFSPEFLTEKNSVNDFLGTNRIILGGSEDDGRVAFKFFEARWPKKVEEGRLLIVACDSTVAELVKLFTNGLLMTKVLFANEMYQVCRLLGKEYEEVRILSALDPRVGSSHLSVPGPDGHLGAGGHCFPKDVNNLKRLCKELGTGERLFTAVLERNDELREKKDWQEMKGRAVIDE